MDEKTFKKYSLTGIIIILFILTFLIMQPILFSVLFGLILAFIFYPTYKKLLLFSKNKNLTALLICLSVVGIIALGLFFLVPILVRQVFEIYLYLQNADLLEPFRQTFPSLFTSPDISQTATVALEVFVSKISSSIINFFTGILLNLMTILFHIVIILFVFFFGLRDGDKLVDYIKGISPLSKEAERKVFQQFKDITSSVIFGQFVVGVVQGIVTGIAFFLFGVPNALTLTLLATFIGILPIIGPWLIWVPVDAYLFFSGKTGAAIGLLVYGIIIINWVDVLIRPVIVSKKTQINSALVLMGMIGGLLVFGILGLIIGPLIISYFLLLLEFYKKERTPSLVITQNHTIGR